MNGARKEELKATIQTQFAMVSELETKLQEAESENTRLRDAILHIRGVAATDGFVTVAWLIDRCDAALEGKP